MQNPKAKHFARLRRKIAGALKSAKHAQRAIAELSFTNADTLEQIEHQLSDALSEVRALASH